MKKKILFVICDLLFFVVNSFAQIERAKPFESNDIFQTRYFIQNNGQFDLNQLPIKFALDHNGDQIFFNQHGFTWRMSKFAGEPGKEKMDKQHEANESAEKRKIVTQLVSMQWLNANPDCFIETNGRSHHYFTYGESKYNSYGYHKIIYKNMYPHIDIEYTIPKEGGIKYSILLHPGSNLNDVKMKYTGKDVHMKQIGDRVIVRTGIRDLMDSKLNAFDEDGKPIHCRFNLDHEILGFHLSGNIDPSKTIIIDPWLTQITTLTGTGNAHNRGLDVDYDYQGNLYVYGGGSKTGLDMNMKVAKYSNTGVLNWTFSGMIVAPAWESQGFAALSSNFAVEKLSGKTYVGQGFAINGCVIVRLDANGVYDNFASVPNIVFKELWDMTFDCNSGSVIGMGGGISSNINFGIIDSSGGFNFANVTSTPGIAQDVVTSTISPSGELFIGMTSIVGTPILDNTLIRVNNTLSGNLWIAPMGYTSFSEYDNKPYIDYNNSNGFNAIHANSFYLYYYDGLNLKALDKTNGTQVGNTLAISGNTLKFQGGIYADECDNVYLGGNNGNILVYHFNGTAFSALPDITLAGMSGRHIYDIKYNLNNNLLYVSGDSLVATVPRSQTCVDTSNLNSVLLFDCTNAIIQLVNGDSTALYTYIWTDSTTGTVVQTHSNSNLWSDTLSTTIAGHVYQILVIKNEQCSGASQLHSFVGGSYVMINNNPTICTGQNVVVNGNTYSVSGTYLDTLINPVGCDTIITTNLTVTSVINVTTNPIICNGQSVNVNGNIYNLTGTYIDSLISIAGCDSVISTHLTVIPTTTSTLNYSICNGQNVMVNGNMYTTTGIYHDTISNAAGCDSIITTNLTVIPISIFNQSFTICNGQSILVNGNVYTTSGLFHDTMVNAVGCDSIIHTNLTVQNYTKITHAVTLCNGDSYTVNGHTYSLAGTYIDTLQSPLLCDTIITTLLNVGQSETSTQQSQLCDGESITINGNTYSVSGIYRDSFLNVKGCDSIIITELQIISNSMLSRNIQVCNGQAVSVNEHVYTESGIYNDTLQNAAGCDSVVITILDVNHSATNSYYIPNGFSPNGDQVNDCLGLKYWKDIEELKFIIYNRWGQLVFETDNVNDCWDGNFKNKKADIGVYFYYIKAKTTCGNLLYKGDITLLR